MRNFENFQKSLGGNDPRLVSVLNYGQTLTQTNPFQQEKIRQRCEQIKKKREELDKKAFERNEQLKQQLRLQEFIQEIQDVEEWIGDKNLVLMEEPTRDRSLATTYSRFKAFEGELEANKGKLDRVISEGEKLMADHPQLRSEVEPKVNALKNQWEDMKEKAHEKSLKLADANREKLFDETAKSMMTWITEVRSQVVTTTEEVTEEIGLVEINEQLKDQEKKDSELAAKRRLLQDMQMHADKLKEQYPERREEFEQVHQEVRLKLTELEAPLLDRRDKLAKQKRVRQFMRDIYDEIDWCTDKWNLIADARVGNSLLTTQQLKRRHRMLAKEVENHEPRINAICQ
ncbi:Spectrin beta chain, non-erythrocytic 1, partial [Cichlidogyrus casuarinus]